MSPLQKAEFFFQLATMLRGGLPIAKALSDLESTLRLPVIGRVSVAVAAGESLELAFAQPEFSAFEQTFITAGNQTGQLEKSCLALAEYWQQEVDLGKTLRTSTLYPAFLIHLALILGPANLLFQDLKQYLVAEALLFTGLYGSIFAYIKGLHWVWNTAAGQGYLRQVPILGEFWQRILVLRWVQIARMEFQAGLPLPQAVNDAWKGTGVAGVDAWLESDVERLRGGENLSEIWSNWRWMPGSWKSYIATAEQSGQLSQTLDFLLEQARKEYALSAARVRIIIPIIVSTVVMLAIGIRILVVLVPYFQEINNLTN